MKFQLIRASKSSRCAAGAALAVVCGWALWGLPLGEAWENASYDYLFLFATRAVPDSNNVVLVLIDDATYREFQQTRELPVDRSHHSKLLNNLADAGCRMVVLDLFFENPRDANGDEALAEAMRRQGHVILAARFLPEINQGYTVSQSGLQGLILEAAFDWAYADVGVVELQTPRWQPFSALDGLRSLPKIAAQAAGAQVTETGQKRWLRYYGGDGGWKHCSYHRALSQPPDYFHNKIVFVGSDPERKNNPDYPKKDKFHAPYTRWTGESVGGVEILTTTFLNLMNGDWLRRPAWWVEVLALAASGLVFGGGFCRLRPLAAFGVAAGAALGLTMAAAAMSYFSNYWFPWFVIVGGQLPCALGWSLWSTRIQPPLEVAVTAVVPQVAPASAPAQAVGPSGTAVTTDVPNAPDYELFHPPFGEGGFGKVWLVRNAIGQWQALKAVYQSKFGKLTGPYEAEFKGIERYKPVSEKHPGLLRIDFISRMKPDGYFYYVMELGDGQTSDWQKTPETYKPWDLAHLRARSEGGRVPVIDCIRIGLALAEALDFLHREGLTHRDIKPSNVIFVNGQPKLADVGLVSEIRLPEHIHTYAGTLGYMPPPPEPPGTVPADIYALGMVLYVVSTGRNPEGFPVLSTTLMDRPGHGEFMLLNAIILKACQPDPARRYASAAEMQAALQAAYKSIDPEQTNLV